MDLIAPAYNASSAFAPPVHVQAPLGIDDVSVADLMRTPAVRAALERTVPMVVEAIQSAAVQPYVENLTFRAFMSMSPAAPEGLDQLISMIDATLLAVPASERPYYGR